MRPHRNRRLTEENVLEMLEMHDSGSSDAELALKFNITRQYIYLIRSGKEKCWKDLVQKYYSESNTKII